MFSMRDRGKFLVHLDSWSQTPGERLEEILRVPGEHLVKAWKRPGAVVTSQRLKLLLEIFIKAGFSRKNPKFCSEARPNTSHPPSHPSGFLAPPSISPHPNLLPSLDP